MDPQFLISLVGYTAGVLTTLAFLPQAIKAWRTRSVGDLSLPTFSMQTTGVFLWFSYGVLNADIPLSLANFITLLINLAVLAAILKARWGGESL